MTKANQDRRMRKMSSQGVQPQVRENITSNSTHRESHFKGRMRNLKSKEMQHERRNNIKENISSKESLSQKKDEEDDLEVKTNLMGQKPRIKRYSKGETTSTMRKLNDNMSPVQCTNILQSSV